MKIMKSKFLKVYANLPVGVRSEIIAVIDNEPMTWNVCWLEVKQNTKLSKKILEYLTKMKFI